MKKVTLPLLLTAILGFGFSNFANDIPEHTWTCISLGESMPGVTCQICVSHDENGNKTGDSVICN